MLLTENAIVLTESSLNFVPGVQTDYKSALVQVIGWYLLIATTKEYLGF